MFLGEFPIVNHHLLKDLTDLGLWTEDVKLQMIADKGSIQVNILIKCIIKYSGIMF